MHKYFSPYQSPYDAYIFYMNALTDMEYVLNEITKQQNADRSAKPVPIKDLQINALTAAPAKKEKEEKMESKSIAAEELPVAVFSSTSSNIKEDVLKKVKSLAKKIVAAKPKAIKKAAPKKAVVKATVVKEKALAKVMKKSAKPTPKKKTK